MAARSTSALLLFCMLYCVFMLLVTNVTKAEGGSQLPVCGNKEGCGGIWCKDEKRPAHTLPYQSLWTDTRIRSLRNPFSIEYIRPFPLSSRHPVGVTIFYTSSSLVSCGSVIEVEKAED
ncbi:hypothetical protein F2Q69_00055716 [Brassica cretica]|uniref:Leucine-rich repeat-containing N-terminal plant-type domain-containing protein n=1 Tax=Brassica cretica TaxID=69181 RepID=A0A8S9N424_BRACR|nr:hypothetical protein F2Q69_00055716 [Brassica cretica]